MENKPRRKHRIRTLNEEQMREMDARRKPRTFLEFMKCELAQMDSTACDALTAPNSPVSGADGKLPYDDAKTENR